MKRDLLIYFVFITIMLVIANLATAQLVINEILADPASGTIGDANGDGVRDASDDEFMEFVNQGETELNISGWQVLDTNSTLLVRHIFPEGSIIPAGGALVVFGGGSPTGTFGNSIVQVASSGGLGISNSNEELLIVDAVEDTVIKFGILDYGNDMSWTRDPDITGEFFAHSSATGANGALFSPGTKIDGSYFIEPDYTIVEMVATSVLVKEGDGTYKVIINITSPSEDTDTEVDLVLTDGDATLIGNYTTQSLTFPAGSSLALEVEITLTDDSDAKAYDENTDTLVFELQNIAGGTSAVLGASAIITLVIEDDDVLESGLVLNEYCSRPSGSGANVSVDANGDDHLDATEDEFIELINSGESNLDITGWTIWDSQAITHTFESLILKPGEAVVVFGGGTPTGTFGYSHVVLSSTANLSLLNGGDDIRVYTNEKLPAVLYSYDDSPTEGQSVTRSPDITGDFITHELNNSNGLYISPGTKVDGSLFVEITTPTVAFSSAKGSVSESAGTYDLTLTLLAPSDVDETSIDVVIQSGDASKIGDYATSTVTFAPGETSKTLQLTITDDELFEAEDVIVFVLESPSAGAEIGSQSTFELTITEDEAPSYGLVINEVMVRPAGSTTSIDVDTNGDGLSDISDDEFIELVNVGIEPLDITGWSVSDEVQTRHVFGVTIVEPGAAVVVFGGGTPTGEFGKSQVFVASTGSLGFTNDDDMAQLYDNNGDLMAEYAWGVSPTDGESLTRNPDITGEFDVHPSNPLLTGGFSYSPGTKVDGTPFVEIPDGTTVFFDQTQGGVWENKGSFEFQVSIDAPSIIDSTIAVISITTENADSDIVLATDTVVFGAGSFDNQTVIVEIINDEEKEGDELFTISIVSVLGGDNGRVGTSSSFTLDILDDDVPLLINEIHANPASGTAGDANGDGRRDATEDEFLEIVNISSQTIDIGGWEIYDAVQLRHTFYSGTTLQPEGMIVVFGGGLLLSGRMGQSDAQLSTGETLSLTDTGDDVIILTADSTLAARYTYGAEASGGQSLTRNEVLGGYMIRHSELDGTLFSPGVNTLITNIEIKDKRQPIYPNPFQSEIFVDLISEQEAEIAIYSLQGQLVLKQLITENKQRLDVSHLVKGTYVYVWTEGLKTYMGKIIKP